MDDDLTRLRAELAEARLWARTLLTLAERERQEAWGLGDIALGLVPAWLTVLEPRQQHDDRPPQLG